MSTDSISGRYMSFRFESTAQSADLFLWELTGDPDPASWGAFLESVTFWLVDLERRGCRVGVVVDSSGMPSFPASVQEQTGQWRKEYLPLIANTCICASYVAESAWRRSLLTAIFWFARPVVPVKLSLDAAQGQKWVENYLTTQSSRDAALADTSWSF